jgi:hypothetical protein
MNPRELRDQPNQKALLLVARHGKAVNTVGSPVNRYIARII